MKKLNVTQKNNRLNDVYAIGQAGAGGAHHEYTITRATAPGDPPGEPLLTVFFQHGPRNDEASRHGVLDSDLLEVVRNRLEAFQNGPMPSEESERALTHVKYALFWLNERAENRAKRGVLGTMEK